MDEDYSKSSSEEETDRSDDQIGTGRSYECVFCKRGFTTAQALGGHMNIHRKDRAKNRPIIIPPDHNNIKINNSSYGGFMSYNNLQSQNPSHSLHLNYQTFFPESRSIHVTSTSTSTTYGGSGGRISNNMYLSPYVDDLGLGIGQRSFHNHNHDHDNKHKTMVNGDEEDDHLDLELRLGHHHHHP